MARHKVTEPGNFEVVELVGYARVSTGEQHLDLQLDALAKAGVPENNIFVDKVTGWKSKRPGLSKMLKLLRPGWVLVVWKLDRVGRNLKHLLELIEKLEERKVGLRSLTESIDTTTAIGRLMIHVLGSVAQFERDIGRERSMAGSALAKERMEKAGRKWGRPMNKRMERLLPAIRKDALTMSFTELGRKYKMKPTTLQRHIKKRDL